MKPPKSFAAGALPQTPLGELATPPDSVVGLGGEHSSHSSPPMPLTAVVGRLWGLEGKMESPNF